MLFSQWYKAWSVNIDEQVVLFLFWCHSLTLITYCSGRAKVKYDYYLSCVTTKPSHLSITAPDQQPPPSYEGINSTAVRLNWKGPDYPNGLITQYMLFRNGTLVYTLKGDGKAVAEYLY
jgi:hypothetical protein